MPHAQGHAGQVTALLAPPSRSFLVSADAGPAGRVVAWDADSGAPLWSLGAPHAHGVAAAALSDDAAMLATLGAAAPDGPGAGVAAAGAQGQELAVWRLPPLPGGAPRDSDSRGSALAGGAAGTAPSWGGPWTDGQQPVELQQTPAAPQRLAAAAVPGPERQTWLCFGPTTDSGGGRAAAAEVVTNGARRVLAWRLAPNRDAGRAVVEGAGGGLSLTAAAPAPAWALSCCPLPPAATGLKRRVGAMLASVFVPGTKQVSPGSGANARRSGSAYAPFGCRPPGGASVPIA